MAERDPNAIVSEGWIDKKADFEGLKIPDGVDKNALGTQFYAYQRTYKNGRRVIEWYKRGSGGGENGGDAILTTAEDTVAAIKDKWDEEGEKDQKDAAPPGGVPTKTINGQVFRWNPETRAYDLPTGEQPAPSAPSQAAAPGGKPFIDDGPEAGPSGRRWGWNPETRLYDRDLGPSPAAQKPAEAPKPQTVSTNTTEPFIVTRMPDGTLRTEKNPNYKGPEQKPGTILTIKGGDGKTYLVPIDAQGNPGQARDSGVPGEGNQPLPAGMPKFTPDPNKPALGLVEYAEQLAALRASGKLTDKQYQEFVGYAHQQASTEASRLDTITRAQQTAQANEINQRNADQNASLSRLTAANSATQNALDTSLKMAGNFTNDTYRSAGGPILPAVMALQDARAMAWGGMNTPPPVTTAGYPALQQVGQMGLTPAQAGNTVIPAVSALAPGGVPAQNGAAIGPVTAGVTATNAAATNPTGANVQAANEATMQGSNAAFGALGIPPAGQAPAQPIFRPMPVTAPVQPTDPQAMQQPGVLPAVNTLGIAAEVAAARGYSPEVMEMAQRELGWS